VTRHATPHARLTALIIGASLAGIALTACGEGSAGREEPSPAVVPAGAESASAVPASQSALPASPEVGAAVQAVVERTGPGGLGFSVALRTEGASPVHRAIGMRTLEVALRSRELAHYPCTSCHAGAQVSAARAQDAHQDIAARHPSEARGACGVCHARSDVARLVLQGGESATLDEAYRLCAQCHFPQTEAWAGGAHGKRLVGWRGERVVLGCAHCHDPHAPTTPRRVPFAGPILP
jgi:hypothetical protein